MIKRQKEAEKTSSSGSVNSINVSTIAVVDNAQNKESKDSPFAYVDQKSITPETRTISKQSTTAENSTLITQESDPANALPFIITSSPPKVVKKIKPVKPVKKNEVKPVKPTIKSSQSLVALEPQSERSFTLVESAGRSRYFANNEELILNDELFAQQQKSYTLELEIGKSVILYGKNIVKYLTTNQEQILVERVDLNRIRVKAVRRGRTILYVWDDKGRWTFNIRCEYPYATINLDTKARGEQQAKPFRLGYVTNWGSFYKGNNAGSLTRQSLSFNNWLGIDGDTPYGYFDASANTVMFSNSTEVVGQRIGLTNAHVGPFNDFTIRGYDTFKELSELTIAGRYFRGFLIDAYAFDHNISYSYFKGQDQATTLYTESSSFARYQSFVEGFKLTLNPDELDNYSFNYGRGYGSALPVDNKDDSFSLETNQKFKEWEMHSEIGYDRDTYAAYSNWNLQRRDLTMNFGVKDYDKNYQTVFGLPSGAGLLSGLWSMGLNKEEYQFSAFIDMYRERTLPNPKHPDLVNFDMASSITKSLNETSSLGLSLAYTATPQVISSRQFAQESLNYNKNYKLGSRYLSMSLGQTWQWSRYDNNIASDYDRFGLRAGFRLQLIQFLFYSMNYDYAWVHDVATNNIYININTFSLFNEINRIIHALPINSCWKFPKKIAEIKCYRVFKSFFWFYI